MCAYYMVCGVPCDVFWNGDYTTFKNYVRAHELSVEQRNQELWMQGYYIYEAFAVVMHNAFSKTGKKDYPKEPHRVTPLSDYEKKVEQEKTLNSFRNQLMALDRKFKKKQKDGGEMNGS